MCKILSRGTISLISRHHIQMLSRHTMICTEILKSWKTVWKGILRILKISLERVSCMSVLINIFKTLVSFFKSQIFFHDTTLIFKTWLYFPRHIVKISRRVRLFQELLCLFSRHHKCNQDTLLFFNRRWRLEWCLEKESWKGILENRFENRPFVQDGSPR